MYRFSIFFIIVLVAVSSFYFIGNNKKLVLPLKTIELEAYKVKFPKNVISIKPTKDAAEEFIAILNNGYVFEDGRVITENSEIFDNVATLKFGDENKNNSLLNKQDFPEVKKFNGTLAVVAANGQENYYQWLFQIIPRIALIKKSKLHFDKIYVYNVRLPYQKETLKVLGLDEDAIYYGRGEVFLQAEKLIVPSIPVKPALNKEFPDWVIKFLNKTFSHHKEAIEFPRKIFISRSKASARRIINESELVKALEAKGFEKIFLEDLKITEQAQLFFNAKEIIGVHGSGLSNLVFCKKDTKIIEINPVGGHVGPYAILSKQIGLYYSEFDTDAKYLTKEQVADNDVYIEIPKFMKMLINQL